MDKILEFAAKLVDGLYEGIPSYGLCVMLIALAGKLLFLPMGKRYYHSITAYDQVAPKVDKLRKKYASNPEKSAQELSKLLSASRYPLFGGLTGYLGRFILSLLVMGVFSGGGRYLAHAGAVIPFGPLELTRSPFALLAAGSMRSAPLALVCVAVTVMLCIRHDSYMDQFAFVSQGYLKLFWLLLAGLCMLLNQAFMLYWFTARALDWLHILYITKIKRRKPSHEGT